MEIKERNGNFYIHFHDSQARRERRIKVGPDRDTAELHLAKIKIEEMLRMKSRKSRLPHKKIVHMAPTPNYAPKYKSFRSDHLPGDVLNEFSDQFDKNKIEAEIPEGVTSFSDDIKNEIQDIFPEFQCWPHYFPKIYFLTKRDTATKSDIVVYVGETVSLHVRMDDHFKRKFQDGLGFDTVFSLDVPELTDIMRKTVESALIKIFQPDLNQQSFGYLNQREKDALLIFSKQQQLPLLQGQIYKQNSLFP